MNFIQTGFISDPNIQQPFTGPSLFFLQNATIEIAKASVYGAIGESLYNLSNTVGVVVGGCTKSAGNNTIFNGWIFYNGELYYFPGATGLNSYVNVPVFVADNYFDISIDPVEFSDNIFRSVHSIQRLKVVDQASGTGLWDMSTMGRKVSATELLGSTTATTVAATLTNITGTSFTSPNRICDLEITFIGDMVYSTFASAFDEGGDVYIYNQTASAVLNGVSFLTNVGVGGPVFSIKSPFAITKVFRKVPANTVIKGAMSRLSNSSNNITVAHPLMSYKEITTPALW